MVTRMCTHTLALYTYCMYTGVSPRVALSNAANTLARTYNAHTTTSHSLTQTHTHQYTSRHSSTRHNDIPAISMCNYSTSNRYSIRFPELHRVNRKNRNTHKFQPNIRRRLYSMHTCFVRCRCCRRRCT